MIGTLGDIVFTVSSEQVETFSNMQWGGSARIGTHQRHITNALTEFTGRDPDTISFDMRLVGHLGTVGIDVMGEIAKIWVAERDGVSLPLTIGEKAYGKYRWLIKSHKTKMQTFDGGGRILEAIVSVSLIEYITW